MDARNFLEKIALPLYQRFRNDAMADDLRWAAIIALNQIPDYLARDELPTQQGRDELSRKARKIRGGDEDLNKLGIIADALKHSLKISKDKAFDKDKVVARSETLRDDFFANKDFFGESDFFGARVIDIDGCPVSINPLLERVVVFWTDRLVLHSR